MDGVGNGQRRYPRHVPRHSTRSAPRRRDCEGDAMGRYHQRRDEHALAAFRETCDLSRDLNALRANRDTAARN